ncbi:hypothetical protein, partial [Legionella moravica]|uniref:hypothetical protein n=2 Tax=Legionella moravica TaxID=39962 RepID=UPI001EE6C216
LDHDFNFTAIIFSKFEGIYQCAGMTVSLSCTEIKPPNKNKTPFPGRVRTDEVRQNAQRRAHSAAKHFGRALARRKAERNEQKRMTNLSLLIKWHSVLYKIKKSQLPTSS